MKNRYEGFRIQSVQWIVYLIILIITFGCSWFSKSKEDLVELPPPRLLQSVVPKKPAKKEPGSLWSDDSKWNELYSVGPTRQPGDMITVRVTDSLKARIAQLVSAKTGKSSAEIRNGGNPLPTPGPAAPATPDRGPASVKDGKPDEKTATAQPTQDKKKDSDTKAFEATILEVMPNGIYRIASNQGLKVGGPEEPYVALEGNLREKEVAADDTVSADSLLATKLEIVDMNKPNVIPGDKISEANAAAAQAQGGK